MKRYVVGALALAIVLGLSFSAMAVPDSFPLRLRGGRELRVHTAGTRAPATVRLVIEFNPSDRRAGDGLRPGQGAWLDRGVGRGEPGRLEWTLNDRAAQRIIDNLESADNYYTFDCFRVGGENGYFQITRIVRADVRR